jgi:hypothetical protein
MEMRTAIQTDFNEMLVPLIGFAESMLQEGGEFRPFGARLAAGGQLALIDVAPTIDDGEASNPLIVDALYATFRLEARAGTIRACAVCWDALVPRETGGGFMDAIAVGLEHRDGDPTIVLLAYERAAGGEYRFQEPITGVGRRHVFGNVMLS